MPDEQTGLLGTSNAPDRVLAWIILIFGAISSAGILSVRHRAVGWAPFFACIIFSLLTQINYSRLPGSLSQLDSTVSRPSPTPWTRQALKDVLSDKARYLRCLGLAFVLLVLYCSTAYSVRYIHLRFDSATLAAVLLWLPWVDLIFQRDISARDLMTWQRFLLYIVVVVTSAFLGRWYWIPILKHSMTLSSWLVTLAEGLFVALLVILAFKLIQLEQRSTGLAQDISGNSDRWLTTLSISVVLAAIPLTIIQIVYRGIIPLIFLFVMAAAFGAILAITLLAIAVALKRIVSANVIDVLMVSGGIGILYHTLTHRHGLFTLLCIIPLLLALLHVITTKKTVISS
ncbi:hypothetical protein CANCADRAFT_69027 [Tortispora caseinolytica NRRL Y-17796]|uniref:Uncharacterized protein n=1 Tax=Tortispora caseinolytica NRRL Y-17796 TaxID=767744 RepID=A0A1E4TH16_9ASCO|nr:hypothetical protein CANCADRAFT_69027 [Tortispora caseinolytica NRRL Y-17796]